MMESRLTAAAQTERERKRERLLKAAVDWVFDQSCSEALMELEDAAADLIGTDKPQFAAGNRPQNPLWEI